MEGTVTKLAVGTPGDAQHPPPAPVWPCSGVGANLAKDRTERGIGVEWGDSYMDVGWLAAALASSSGSGDLMMG